jgi:hypothetical protein
MKRTPAVISLLLIVGLTFACKKAEETESQPTDILNRAEKTPSNPPVNLVNGNFKVTTFTKFEFEVPAHSITPKLEGRFESSEINQSGASANIDLLVMTPDEFEEFSHGRGGTASYSVTGSPSQTVAFALPSTFDSPQKYFVVFRNPAGKSSPKTVKAELTASF